MDSMTLNKLAAGLLLAGIIAMFCGLVAHALVPEHAVTGPSVALPAMAAADTAEPVNLDPCAGIDPIEAPLQTADAGGGKKIFDGLCATCHTIAKGSGNSTGPNLYGVVGHAKAGHDGFAYSGGLVELGGDWNYEALNCFLAKPAKLVRDTKMMFPGLSKVAQRAAVIAYLRSMHDAPPALPGIAAVDPTEGEAAQDSVPE